MQRNHMPKSFPPPPLQIQSVIAESKEIPSQVSLRDRCTLQWALAGAAAAARVWGWVRGEGTTGTHRDASRLGIRPAWAPLPEHQDADSRTQARLLLTSRRHGSGRSRKRRRALGPTQMPPDYSREASPHVPPGLRSRGRYPSAACPGSTMRSEGAPGAQHNSWPPQPMRAASGRGWAGPSPA